MEEFLKTHVDIYDKDYPHCVLGIVVHNSILSHNKEESSYGVQSGFLSNDIPNLDVKKQKITNKLIDQLGSVSTK